MKKEHKLCINYTKNTSNLIILFLIDQICVFSQAVEQILPNKCERALLLSNLLTTENNGDKLWKLNLEALLANPGTFFITKYSHEACQKLKE